MRGVRSIVGATSLRLFYISLLLIGAFVSIPSVKLALAEDAKIEADPTKPGELNLPDDITVVDDKTKGKKLGPACDKCQKEGDALKAALSAYYAAQAMEGYWGKGADAKAQEKAGVAGMKDILGMTNADMTTARKTYNTAKKSTDKKIRDSVTPEQLLKKVNDALDAYRKCAQEKCPEKKKEEKKDPEKEKKKSAAEQWVEKFSEFADFGFDPKDLQAIENWATNLVFPKCGDKDEWKKKLTKLIADVDEKAKAVEKAIGATEGGEKMKDAAKKTQAALKAAKTKIQEFIDKTLPTLNPCTDDGSMYFPGPPFDGGGGKTYAVVYTDTGTVCTFGLTEPIDAPLTPTDVAYNPLPPDRIPQDGTPIERPKTPPTDGPGTTPEEMPKTPSNQPTTTTERLPEQPKAPEEPKKPEEPKAPEQPTTTTEKPPEQPKQPDETPTTQTTDATPTDDIVILFKGNQEVLERGQTGEALQGQHLMLVFKKPDLRESGTGKTAKDDSGFDKDGVRAVTGGDGQAKLRVPAEDRALYLSNLGDKPKKYYRIDAVAAKNTGRVSEIARNANPDLTGGPAGARVVAEVFRIGERVFVRRLYSTAYDAKVDQPNDEKDDWCRVVEPGPPLGLAGEYPAGQDLPASTVTLSPLRPGRRAP
jgi:hypothetical protein